MFKYLFAGFVLIVFAECNAQKNPVFTLYLIGDAGESYLDETLYKDTLQHRLRNDNAPHAVIFLGDNIYPSGMPNKEHKNRLEAERILSMQLAMVRSENQAHVYVVPGNHDWRRGGKDGLRQILNQQAFVDSLKDQYVHFLPRDGCPGPVEVSLANNVVLVIMDTQWAIHPWEKPEGEDSPCDSKSTADIITNLRDVLLRNEGKRVIIAGHHPVFTYGEHGGVYSLKQHIFPLTDVSHKLYVPLPVLGSLYPLYRKYIGDIQDIAHPLNKKFRTSLIELMEEFPGTIYTNGHEHALQYAYKDSVHYVGSGAGVKNTFVRQKGYAQFVSQAIGYARIVVYDNGEAVVEYYGGEAESKPSLLYKTSLNNFKSDTKKDTRFLTQPALVKAKASMRYETGVLHNKLFGTNYRDIWSKEVEVPVFDLGKEHGGLKILQRGGGMQTLSLRLVDSIEREFTLRSVEKFPEKAVPEIFKKTFAEDIVQDQISAAHPYAALVIPPLAKAAEIYYTNPKLVYLADDVQLGVYRKDFGNQLMIFEERPAGSARDQVSFGNAEKVNSTTKVLEKLAEDNDNHVDQQFVLRSRVFDLFIGDWDRHDDQWRWAVFKEKGGEMYRPIPRDRDQAFFVNEGIIPKIWSRRWALPKLQGFDTHLNWPEGFMYNGRYFDRSFLNALRKEDWILSAESMAKKMSDAVIDSALHTWPSEIFASHGDEIIAKLKARRGRLARYALRYYLFLAREVDVVGSNKVERFEVERKDNGNTIVTVFKCNKQGEKQKQLYQREFYPAETNEVRLFGLGGADQFVLTGDDALSTIKVRIIGGDGQDQLVNVDGTSHRKTHVYDLREGIATGNSKKFRDHTATDLSINDYNRKAFQYDRLMPLVYGNYNIDDGVFLGGGFLYTRHGFRKDPYKSQHVFVGSYAVNTSSFNFKYDGRFTKVIGNWNLDIDADIKSPNYVNNFFGLGNESIYDRNIDDRPGVDVEHPIQYYRLRFKQVDLGVKLHRQIGRVGFIKAGPVFQSMEIEDTKGKDRYIADYDATLLKSVIEVGKMFAGAAYDWGVDTRNSTTFTTRGVYLHQSAQFLAGVKPSSHRYIGYNASVAFYQTFKFPAKVTFALRAGGGINDGAYELYQAQILDGKTELRGFRKTRFYGDSKLFANAEVRLKLVSLQSYLFPASLGVLGFFDTGRVWYRDTNGNDPTASSGKSNVWHQGFGGGLWFTPFNKAVISMEVGHSVEETLAYLRLGFLF